MSKTYVIQWKSNINGRAGKGTKQFALEEAETLVRELNQEYPNIHHEIVEAEHAEPELQQASAENQANPTEPEEGANDNVSYQTHAFSE